MRRPVQDGQKPRPLQLSAIILSSFPQSPHCYFAESNVELHFFHDEEFDEDEKDEDFDFDALDDSDDDSENEEEYVDPEDEP